MQICLLKQIKQTVTAKNTDTVGQGYPLKQSDSYCEKYDCFYEDYLLKQIKETITAKNTDTVGQADAIQQSDSYFEETDCCCQDYLLRQMKMRVPKLTSHPTRQTPKAVSVSKINRRQTIGKTSTFQTIRKATETRQTTQNCLPPLPVVLQQKYRRCFDIMQTACRKRRQNFRKRYCKQNCTW